MSSSIALRGKSDSLASCSIQEDLYNLLGVAANCRCFVVRGHTLRELKSTGLDNAPLNYEATNVIPQPAGLVEGSEIVKAIACPLLLILRCSGVRP